MWGRLTQVPRDVWRYVAAPDDKVGWVPFAVRAGTRLMRRERFDAIFVTGKPFSSFWIGHALSRRFGTPWVMDLRDLWTLNRRMRPRSRLHHGIESWMERTLVHSASAVIANTPGNRRDFIERHPDCPADKFVAITNGYDGDDFAEDDVPKFEKFTIAYTGNFYFQEPRRPSAYRRLLGLDARRAELYETHSPKYLFQALAAWLNEHPELRPRVEVRLAGAGGKYVDRMVQEFGLSDVVVRLGWLTHAESMRLLRQSHAACVVLSRGVESEGWIPSKLYQYLGAGIPILALIPEGDAADILRITATGQVVPPDNVDAIQGALTDLFERHASAEPFQPDWGEVEHYERRHLTARLASVLDEVSRNPVRRVHVDEPLLVCGAP
jgi:glycosyltransferase involved in cell wall biosynthesis